MPVAITTGIYYPYEYYYLQFKIMKENFMELFCLWKKGDDTLKMFSILTIFSFLFVLLSMVPAVHAENVTTEKVVVYDTDFLTEPGWKTNNPSRYYWNAEKESYHYLEEGGTGGYAFTPIDYNGESFTLEFTITPTKTDQEAVMDFGMGTEDMDVTHGTVVLYELAWKKYGKIMGLKVITPDNHLYEARSNHLSYGGETVNFEDNITYKVIIQYNRISKTVTIKVMDAKTDALIWGYYVQMSSEINFLNRIMLSSVGNYDSSGVVSEGYIGNVSLVIFKPAVQLTTITTTIPVTTEEFQTPEMTITETPEPSTPVSTPSTPVTTTTTKAGSGSLIFCTGLAISMLLLLRLRR